jgi:ATP-dependent DNA helicase DinG
MAQVIRRYLDYAKEPCDPLLVEAGTGVGKSFAYLVAVCEWLKKEKKNNPKAKAVIATHTLALEDQLIKKDIPIIKGLYPTLCFEKAQGRTNYVCRHKLEQLTGGGLFADENDKYDLLLDWLAHTQSGDRTELTFNPGSMWNQICSGTDCLGASCPHRQGCYYQEMKERILATDIIVTTHAMVMSDLVIKSLPDYQVLVLDEAHNIEKSAFSAGTTSVNLSTVMNAIEKPLTKSFCHAALKRSRMVKKIRQWQKETKLIAETFFMEVKEKIQSHSLRLHKPCFDPGLASAIEIGMGFLDLALENVDTEIIKAETAAVIDELGSLASAIRTFVSMDNDGYVYWIDSNGINYCPVDVSTFLKPLFDSKVSVLTSATLTVAGSFDSFKKSIGLKKAFSCKYNNSFDYKNNSIVYVPPGAPSPKEKNYTKYAIDQVSTILGLTKGKTFVLFTSYQMMTEVYQEVHALLGDDFVWLVQGTDTKERLLQAYRSSSNSVLFGVDSYWEGIDEDINCVVITKMPFAVPTNPLEEAQYELLKSRGGNPFMEKAIPQCAIKLKQGTGRLIRHKQKRGAVVILDPRINCNWGCKIKKSLPFTTWTEDISIMKKYV